MFFIRSFSEIYISYIAIFVLLSLLGKSFLKIYFFAFYRGVESPRYIFSTPSTILYPIFGYFFLGNVLVILNFFTPIVSSISFTFIALIALCGIDYRKPILKFNKVFTINLALLHLIIPSILLFSTYDMSLHYDAGYYHLNHQNWLRSSNIVIGLVNLFWPFGISALSEYVSGFFWRESTLINIHYLSLIFISSFFQFIYFQITEKKDSFFKISSVFILIFSIFDNFGFEGGRNGFIYIQEIGKQDSIVSVLVILISIFIANDFKNKNYHMFEKGLIIILILLAFQLKIGSVYLFIFLFFYLLNQLNKKLLTFKNVLYISLPSSLFLIVWLLKNYLTSGCFVFPVSFTCINNFNWYRKGSTEWIEEYTSSTSFGMEEYFGMQNNFFTLWFNEFFINNDPFSTFYKSYYLNFLVSLIAIYVLKKLFTKTSIIQKDIILNISLYLFLSVLFLMTFGPIPRYTAGILTFTIAMVSLNVISFKVNLNPKFIYLVFFISLLLLPRMNSYLSSVQNQNIALPDPRFEVNDYSLSLNDNWVSPKSTDLCWINLNCTSEVGGEIVKIDGFFKTIFRNLE